MPDGSDARRRPVLVVGRGLIGSAAGEHLRGAGRPVVTVGRAGTSRPDHLSCDLGTASGRGVLRAELRRRRPGCVLLAHGPSDVSWIERNEAAAEAAHLGVARLLAEERFPTVLVSTDNVFAGDHGGCRPADGIRPGNAYGRVKAKAERALSAGGRCLVLRVSLVYGWTGSGHRATYAQRCLDSALRAEPLSAPTDQVFTPVHVADVAVVVSALCRSRRLPTGHAHLSGPLELSRFEFARAAYRAAGADEDLVRPCLRGSTEWASRPRFSSLRCDDFGDVRGLEGWRPMPPYDGLRLMLRTVPRAAVPA